MRQPPVLTPQDAANGGAPATATRAVSHGPPPPAAARAPAAAPARPPAAGPMGAPPAPPASPAPASAAARPGLGASPAPAPAAVRPVPGLPPAGGVGASAASAASGEARPVEEFFYQGERALGRALELRPELERALVAGEPRARELLAEVFDLIALARA